MDDKASVDILPTTSDAVVGHEVEDDDSWVLVEKQVITILVPPPSPRDAQATSPTTEWIQPKSRDAVKKGSPATVDQRNQNARAEKRKCISGPSEHRAKTVGFPGQASETSRRRPSGRCGGSSEKQLNLGAKKRKFSEPNSSSALFIPARNVSLNIPSNGKNTSRKFKSSSSCLSSTVGAVDVVNLRVRAANLERRLASFGGLRRWLVSLGLVQFAGIFEEEKMDKFRMVNLTMGKLKELGAMTVGPRRKLLHAIDRISQPYFLKGA